MSETPVVKIETLDQLKKILFVQRQITRRVHDELEALSNDNVIDSGTDPAKVKKFMQEEAELLASYVNRPTLTEWAQQGGFSQSGFYDASTSWGATFGVIYLINYLLLNPVRKLQPQYGGTVKGLLQSTLMSEWQMRLNMEQNQSSLREGSLSFDMRNEQGQPLAGADRKNLETALREVMTLIIGTGIEYGLFKVREDGTHVISNIGVRVLLHMQDVQRFITAMGDAHKKFQREVVPQVPVKTLVLPKKRRTKLLKSGG